MRVRARLIAVSAVWGLLAWCQTGAALAADASGYRPFTAAPVEGLRCEDPAVKAFPAVWLGHFSGGYSHYAGPGSVIVLDWHDEKLCFPGRRACDRYIADMRRDYHRPEGEYTCLAIR